MSAYHLSQLDVFTTRSVKKQWYTEKGTIQLETAFTADKGRTYIVLYLGDIPVKQELTSGLINKVMASNGWHFQGTLVEGLQAALTEFTEATKRTGESPRSDDATFARAGRALRDAVQKLLVVGK